ncbi:MAG: hypothetical protein Kow00129_00530 [Thermoleophilia bacterium]
MRQRDADVLHTHGFRANFVGRLAAGGLGLPVVTTVHSSVHRDYSAPHKKLLYHRIERLTRGYTDRFIAVSAALARELLADGVEAGRVEVIPNGLELADLEIHEGMADGVPASSLRSELGLTADTPIIISVGRLESVKNQHMLLQVFANLRDQEVSFHGVLVGEGPLAGPLRRRADELRLMDNVSFLGFREDVPRLLAEADVFVLTSIMEGLPLTLLEAMRAGTPVVATGVGGLPEAIALAGNGFAVPEGDAELFALRVRRLLEDGALRRRFAESGRRALREHFSAEVFLEKTVAVYERVAVSGRFEGELAEARAGGPPETVRILGKPAHVVSMSQAVSYLTEQVERGNKQFVVAQNPEKVMRALEDEELSEIMEQKATLLIPDGTGLVLAARVLGLAKMVRVTGVGLFDELLRAADQGRKRVFLFGAAPGVPEKVREELARRYPGIEVCGCRHGYEVDTEAVVEQISAVRPDYLFVALGSPRQEKWIAENLDRLQVGLAMGVGGSFDVLAGEVKRAPAWTQRLGLEWLYRLVTQPSRLRRQANLPRFAARVLRERF